MKRLFLAATATGLLMAMNASATLVADFNTSGVYMESRAKSTDTLNGDTWNYSDTTPLLNDTGAGGQSGKIYGGVITTWSVAQAYNPWVLKNGNDGFVAHVLPPNVTGTQSVTGAYLWNKADFLAGASDTVQFNAGNSISFYFNWMTVTTPENQQIRLLVKQGGLTYLSEWTTQQFGTALANVSCDPSTTNWAVFDTANYTWGAFSPLTLNNIEGAGLYFTLSVTGGQCVAKLLDFQIDATVVTLPGTDEQIVDFLPSSTVDTGARGVTTSTNNGDTWAYSDTTPLFNDTDVTGQNGRFYGGITTTWSIPLDYTPAVYHAIGGPGFTVQNWPSNGSNTSIKAVYLWNKADFLMGASDIIQFNAASSIYFNFSWLTEPVAPDPPRQLRMVVKQGATTYISESFTEDYTLSSMNPTLTNWAVLNTADYTWGAFSPVTFDDVEGVGIYCTLSRTAENTAIRMTEFKVNARVVPAPVADNYASWADSQVPKVTGGENGDDDNDGAKNLVEYALVNGGERGVLSGNTITFTKRGTPYGSDLTYIIETSETLSDPWSPVVTHGLAELGSPISYDLAPVPGTPIKFARLKVVKTP